MPTFYIKSKIKLMESFVGNQSTNQIPMLKLMKHGSSMAERFPCIQDRTNPFGILEFIHKYQIVTS